MYEKIAGLMANIYERSKSRGVSKCRKHLEKTQWLKKEQLQELKLEKFKALVKHAYDQVPYYHTAFKQVEFKPEDLRRLDDLRKIPVLTKHIMRDKANAMVARSMSRNQLIEWSTSGTTSLPVKVFRDRLDLSWGVGAELRGYSWAGYKVGDKVALIWGYSTQRLSKIPFRLKHFLNRERLLNLKKLSEKSMGEFAEEMVKFEPRFVRGYATGTNVFANFLLRNAEFVIRPEAVFTTAATLFPHYRRSIEQAFGCKVFDYYACNEVSHIAAQCGMCEQLHVSEENVMVEVVEDFEPVADGEDGNVLVTNLNGYGMPLIRYDIGDLGKILDDECACGRELDLIKVVGRQYEYFLNSDGSFTSLKNIQTIFDDAPIQDFQIVQEVTDEIVVKILPKPGFTLAHADFISKNLKVGPGRVRVEVVDSISLGSSGKIERIVRSTSDHDYFAR